MGTENGRARLRGLYTDPARPLTVAVGQVFDLVSMPMAVGVAALDALCSRRVRLGPVVADSRSAVMRVGFLVAPLHSAAFRADSTALHDWADRLSPALGVRVGGPGTTATLPPLLPGWHGWLRWIVPPTPGFEAGDAWTPAGELLSALTELPLASS